VGSADEYEIVDGTGRVTKSTAWKAKPEREGREGDTQAMPVPNDHPPIHDLVVEDILQRQALGIRRYGTPLQPHNGRQALVDLYEELLDAAVYCRQAIEEARPADEPREWKPPLRWQPPARFGRAGDI
jgi:hypothetical protein